MLRRPLAVLVAALLVVLAGSRAQAQITVTGGAATPAASDAQPADPATAIQHARELIAQGNMDQAITELQTYVDAHPDQPLPQRFLGDLYFRSGQVDRAKAIYQALLAKNPQDKDSHNRLGSVYAVENDIDDAIAEYNAALPGTDSIGDLVQMHSRRGDLGVYRDAMARIGSQYPSDPDIQTEVGQVYNALHQPYLATRYFQRALDIDPQNVPALNGLGVALLNMKEFAPATDAFNACLRHDGSSYECRNNLAALQLESGQLDAAAKTLDRAYRLAPERGETFVNYGYLADLQGDWQKGAADYAKAIALFPYLEEAYIDLGISYEEHGLYALAQATLLKGIASVHDDGRLHDLLGDAYLAQGDRTDAVKMYALASKGSDPTAVWIAHERVSTLDSPSPKPTN